MTISIQDIENKLWDQALNVCKYLLSNGHYKNGEWVVGNIYNEQGESLKINLTGKKVWKDFATGEGGGLIQLWCLTRHKSTTEAIKEIKQYLGLENYKNAPVSFKTEKVIKKRLPYTFQTNTGDSEDIFHIEYLQSRKLSLEIINKFKVSSCFILDPVTHRNTRSVGFPYYSYDEKGELYLTQFKRLAIERKNNKKQIIVEKNCIATLFGWQAIDRQADYVVICEGEIDAMSIAQVSGNALSIPFGAGGGRKLDWLENEYDNLQRFKTIYLCFDNDEAGLETIPLVAKRLGIERCKIIQLPTGIKDANQYLQHGLDHSIFIDLLENAKDCEDPYLNSVGNEIENVFNFHTKQESYIFKSSIKNFADKFQFRPHELTILNGINGHGKSQFSNQLIIDCISQNRKAAIATLEITKLRLLEVIAQQAVVKTELTFQDFQDLYSDMDLWTFKVQNNNPQNLVSNIIEIIEYGFKRYGIEFFVIDNLSLCGIKEDDYNTQKDFINKLAIVKNEYPINILLITHPRKVENDCSIPDKADVKGTGAVTDLADNVITIWKNIEKERYEEAKERGENPRKLPTYKTNAVIFIQKVRYARGNYVIGAIPCHFSIHHWRFVANEWEPIKSISKLKEGFLQYHGKQNS